MMVATDTLILEMLVVSQKKKKKDHLTPNLCRMSILQQTIPDSFVNFRSNLYNKVTHFTWEYRFSFSILWITRLCDWTKAHVWPGINWWLKCPTPASACKLRTHKLKMSGVSGVTSNALLSPTSHHYTVFKCIKWLSSLFAIPNSLNCLNTLTNKFKNLK